MFANGLSTSSRFLRLHAEIPPIGEKLNIGVIASPAFTVRGLSAARRFSPFCFLRWQTGGGDSDYPVTRDGRRFATVVRRYRRVGDSRIDRIESRLQQSAKPDPHLGDF